MTKVLLFNNNEIPITIENGIYYIALSPICEILSIDPKTFYRILTSEVVMGKLVLNILPIQIVMKIATIYLFNQNS